jgi:DNA-binding Lrp family transcriptional regulator
MSKAYIMMNCKLGEEKEVVQELKKIVGIKEAHGTFGLYDIVAQIECTTDEKIQEIVTQKIRKIPKIQEKTAVKHMLYFIVKRVKNIPY